MNVERNIAKSKDLVIGCRKNVNNVRVGGAVRGKNVKLKNNSANMYYINVLYKTRQPVE